MCDYLGRFCYFSYYPCQLFRLLEGGEQCNCLDWFVTPFILQSRGNNLSLTTLCLYGEAIAQFKSPTCFLIL